MKDEEFPELSALVGKRVRLRDGSGDPEDVEYGVIVHAWNNTELDTVDCYITFFGNEQPKPGLKPSKQPYTLRYILSSLEECE